MPGSHFLPATILALATIADLPMEERAQRLAEYFEPPPGTPVSLDSRELIEFSVKGDPMKIRGQIQVKKVPDGQCFSITMREGEPAESICRPQILAFRAGDLNDAGEIRWSVGIAGTPFKADLAWPTPHRIARVIPAGEVLPSLSIPVLVERCERVPGQRTLRLKTWDKNQAWVFRFPDQDHLAPQPKKTPNLFMQYERGGIKGSKEHGEAPAEASEHGKEEKPKTKIAPKPLREISSDPTLYWAVPARSSFLLEASRVIIDDGPPGQNGQCHYRLEGAPGDLNSGIIECHHVSGYDVILTNLACASAILTK